MSDIKSVGEMENPDGDAPDDGIAPRKAGSGGLENATPVRAKVKKICKCPTCGKTFSNKSNLSRHTVVHSGQKNFECQICGNRFFRKSDVNVHMSIHATDKDYKCEVCHKNFSSKSNLTRHKIVHTGQKNFACDLCGKEFFRRSDMNEHMIFHTGEKQFKCYLCAKEFFWQSHLNAHMVAHTGERNHACTICEKKFPSKTNLNRHMVVHSGEKNLRCPECGKEFFWKSQFTEHMVIHTGEKNFKCAICQKEFAHRSTLRKHMRSHLMNEIRCETQMNVSAESEPEDDEIAGRDGSSGGGESDVHTEHSGDVFEPSLRGLEGSTVASSLLDSNERTQSDGVKLEKSVKTKEEKTTVIKEEMEGLENIEKDFKCSVCQRDFGHQLTLWKHMRTHLVNETLMSCVENESEENGGSVEVGESSVRTRCLDDICETSFGGMETSVVAHPSLIIPEPTSHVNRPEPCSSVLDMNKLVDVKERTCGDAIELKNCVEIEEKPMVIKEEVDNLGNAENFKCSICQEDFAHRLTLWKHTRIHFRNEMRCQAWMNAIGSEPEDDDGVEDRDKSVAGGEGNVRTGCSGTALKPSVKGLANSVSARPSLIAPEPTCSSVVRMSECVDVKERTCIGDVGLKKCVEVGEGKASGVREEMDELDITQTKILVLD